MKRFILNIAAALLVALNMTYPAFAANGADQCLSFDAALQLNMNNDPTISAAQSMREQASARLVQIKADWRPQLSAYGRAASGQSGLVDGRTDDQMGLVLSQRVFDFGRGRHERNAADARVRASDFDIDSATLDSTQTVAQTYLNVLEARERVAAAAAREDHFAAIVQRLSHRLKANLVTAAQAKSIAAEHALATANRIEEVLLYDAAQSRLVILTGRSNAPCDSLAVIDSHLRRYSPATLDEALGVATTHSTQLQSLKAQRDAARADLATSRRSQLPVLELQGVSAYVRDNVADRFDASNRVGIEVTVPILGGGRFRGQKREAAARLRSAELDVARAQREAQQNITLSWQRIRSFDALSNSRRIARDALRGEADAVRQQFDNGLSTYQELERIEADLQQSILGEIEARYSARAQRLNLLTLTNRLMASVAGENL